MEDEYYNGKKIVPEVNLSEDEDQEKIEDIKLNDVQDQPSNTSASSAKSPDKKIENLKDKLEEATYLKTSYPLMLKYDRDVSAFLSLLIDNEEYNEGKKKEGFFMATRDYYQKKLNITPRIQERVIDVLVTDGLIEYKRKGVPARGWIRLNVPSICSVLDEFKPKEKRNN